MANAATTMDINTGDYFGNLLSQDNSAAQGAAQQLVSAYDAANPNNPAPTTEPTDSSYFTGVTYHPSVSQGGPGLYGTPQQMPISIEQSAIDILPLLQGLNPGILQSIMQFGQGTPTGASGPVDVSAPSPLQSITGTNLTPEQSAFNKFAAAENAQSVDYGNMLKGEANNAGTGFGIFDTVLADLIGAAIAATTAGAAGPALGAELGIGADAGTAVVGAGQGALSSGGSPVGAAAGATGGLTSGLGSAAGGGVEGALAGGAAGAGSNVGLSALSGGNINSVSAITAGLGGAAGGSDTGIGDTSGGESGAIGGNIDPMTGGQIGSTNLDGGIDVSGSAGENNIAGGTDNISGNGGNTNIGGITNGVSNVSGNDSSITGPLKNAAGAAQIAPAIQNLLSGLNTGSNQGNIVEGTNEISTPVTAAQASAITPTGTWTDRQLYDALQAIQQRYSGTGQGNSPQEQAEIQSLLQQQVG